MKLKQINQNSERTTHHTADLSSPQRNAYHTITYDNSIATANIYTHGNQAPGYNTRAEKNVLKTPAEKLNEFVRMCARLT